MRFWCLIAVLVASFAGPVIANVCIVPPRTKSDPPRFPLADMILRETGLPDGDATFIAFGKVAPTNKLPLLHEQFTPLLERAMREAAPDNYEISDTEIEFTYRNHFQFSGLIFRDGALQEVENEVVQFKIGISGEGGYTTGWPTGEVARFWRLESERRQGYWRLGPLGCAGDYRPSSVTDEAALIELEACLPTGSCYD